MEIIPEKSIYVKALLWAYSKQHAGFSKQEMRDFLDLKVNEEWAWVDWLFSSGLSGESPLVWSMPGEDYGKKFYLTATGVAAAVDYLELKEAQASGKRATVIAVTSIVIGVIVGIVQILIQICAK